MDNEERKIGKIVEELTVYFINNGATDITTRVNTDGRNVTSTFKSAFAPENEHEIRKIEEFFEEPRNEGLEDLYWELAGSADAGKSSQLLLIAQMAGTHNLIIENGHVELTLCKKLWG